MKTERRAYVLVTAMPPTKGHIDLIKYASLVGSTAEVIVTTQPGEPFIAERLSALREATSKLSNVNIHVIHKALPQEPEGQEGFWDMWTEFLCQYGFTSDDYIVASESYGLELANHTGSTFIPYDPYREILPGKATNLREDLFHNFGYLLPEFRKYLQMTVTIFGAESTGKTTLSKFLAQPGTWSEDVSWPGGQFVMEWARPYLEVCGPDITNYSMTNIWKGQKALQQSVVGLSDKPLIIQDTDLYSTVGYWDFWTPGECPDELRVDAEKLKSDLYIITRSNIPFEEDPIRYGGDKRESDDQYWIDICEKNNLRYIVLKDKTLFDRAEEAEKAIMSVYDRLYAAEVEYEREGKH